MPSAEPAETCSVSNCTTVLGMSPFSPWVIRTWVKHVFCRTPRHRPLLANLRQPTRGTQPLRVRFRSACYARLRSTSPSGVGWQQPESNLQKISYTGCCSFMLQLSSEKKLELHRHRFNGLFFSLALGACVIMASAVPTGHDSDDVMFRRIRAVRSIQFEKHSFGVEMVAILRMDLTADVPAPGSEVVGALLFRTGVVVTAPGPVVVRRPVAAVEAASKGDPVWQNLGKFRARRSAALGATSTEVEVRTNVGLHQQDRVLRLLAVASEAYAPWSRLQLHLEGQVRPIRGAFWFRRAEQPPRTPLGRWWASFVALPPRNPADEIFKSPDLFDAAGESVDVTTAPILPPNKKQR